MADIPTLLISIKEELAGLEQQFVVPNVTSTPGYPELARRYALLRKVSNLGAEWGRVGSSIAEHLNTRSRSYYCRLIPTMKRAPL